MKSSVAFFPVWGVCLGVFFGAGPNPAWAGFDWVNDRTVQSAPVEQVDRMVLPPPASPNEQPMNVTEPAQLSPVLPVPASPVTPDIVPTGTDIYPPPGNAAARPLAGATPLAPVAMPAKTVSSEPDSQSRAVPVQPTPTGVDRSVTREGLSGPVIQQRPIPQTPVAPVMPAPVVAPVKETASEPLAVIDGFGEDLPLSVAIAQVVPPEFTVEYQDQPNPDLVVSWAGGRPWDKVLEDMIFAHGYRVSVRGKTVILSAVTRKVLAPAVPTAPFPVADRTTSSDLAPVLPVSQPPVALVTAPQPGPVYDSKKIDLFSGRATEPLRTVLDRWAKIANLTVEWTVEGDYPLPQPFAVNSTFPRALQKILELYADQNPPLTATIVSGAMARVTIKAGKAAPTPAQTPSSIAPAPTSETGVLIRRPKYQSPGFVME